MKLQPRFRATAKGLGGAQTVQRVQTCTVCLHISVARIFPKPMIRGQRCLMTLKARTQKSAPYLNSSRSRMLVTLLTPPRAGPRGLNLLFYFFDLFFF
jgi:hypothetical protein